jgi:hypothetical protein
LARVVYIGNVVGALASLLQLSPLAFPELVLAVDDLLPPLDQPDS